MNFATATADVKFTRWRSRLCLRTIRVLAVQCQRRRLHAEVVLVYFIQQGGKAGRFAYRAAICPENSREERL